MLMLFLSQDDKKIIGHISFEISQLSFGFNKKPAKTIREKSL